MPARMVLAVVSVALLAACATPAPEQTGADLGPDSPGTSTGPAGGLTGQPTSSAPRTTGPGSPTGPQACQGTGTVPLTTLPMALEDFAALLPYGKVVGGHVTPIDHMYLTPAEWPGHRDQYEVHAIADGRIADIQTRPSHYAAGSTADSVEYRIWIDHTCTFHSYLDLVTSLSPRVATWFSEDRSGRQPLAITGGELLGMIGGQTLDFGVYNDEKTLSGFLVPEHYERESWKIHTDDPFLYFTEPARSQLLAKDVRNAEPRAGRIDYDVEGRAVGNWFLVGSNGYGGDGSLEYWTGHLALVPDAYLPEHLLVSLGDWDGEAKQFAVKGNGPDFADVRQESGPIKYELVGWNYRDGDDPSAPPFHSFQRPIAHPFAENQDSMVEGTLLVELTGARLLKVEMFPGRSAADVHGFEGAARMYER